MRMIAVLLCLLAANASAAVNISYKLQGGEARTYTVTLPLNYTPQLASGNACVATQWVQRTYKPSLGTVTVRNHCASTAKGTVREVY